MPDTQNMQALAKQLRQHVLRMVHKAKASHVGSGLSCADLIAVLYGHFLNVDPKAPKLPTRDRFILSKGHGGAILYAALAERGFFPNDWLDTYCQNGSPLSGHITHTWVPGVEVSTGSLGHGLPLGCGMAKALLHDHSKSRVVVLISDGECDEGTTWESALFAAHHCLHNLTVIIDYNKIQSYGHTNDVLNLEPLTAKWEAFNWHVQNIDGHDHNEILSALMTAEATPDKPSLIIAHTCKGKGVSFMENQLAWHYKSPSDDQLAQALGELS